MPSTGGETVAAVPSPSAGRQTAPPIPLPQAACAPTREPGPCFDTGPVSGDQPPYDPSTAPEAFLQRSPLPWCGTVSEEQRGPEPLPRVVLDCFVAGLDGKDGAEYAVIALTVEGDTVVRYHRALPGQQVTEVFTDTTRDRLGPRGWLRQSCSGYDGTDGRPTGCSP